MKQFATILFAFTFFGNIFSFSQTSPLQLNEIMSGNDFIGHQPFDFFWDLESKSIYFRWNPEQKLVASFWNYNVKTKKLKIVPTIRSYKGSLTNHFSENGSKYFKRGNTIYHWENHTRRIVYTSLNDFEIIGLQSNTLVIRERDQLHSIGLQKSEFKQLTNFQKDKKPATIITDKNYLEQQQIELFTTEQNKAERKIAQKEFTTVNEDTDGNIAPFYLDQKTLGDINYSIKSKTYVFSVDQYPENTTTNFPAFVTSDGYTASRKARAKVGTKNPSHSLHVTNPTLDTTWTIDFNNLTGRNKKPEYFNLYPKTPIEHYEKEIIFHLHGFNESGNKSLIEIKSYDNKDRWIGVINVSNGKFTEMEHQHDEAWIGGPGISGWNMVPGNVGWIDDNRFFYQSEESGYSHLYIKNLKHPKEATKLTSGKYEIHEAYLNKEKTAFYLSTNETHPGNRSFYKLDINSKVKTPLLTEEGNHETIVSPDEKWLLIKYSNKNTPWDLYIAPNKKDAPKTRITNSQTNAFKSYNWRAPEVITFKARDDKDIHARIYEPRKESKNGAAVLFVHGAGYLQNAHNWWSGYHREFMFNNMLCDLGYTVLDIDYRASKGYGRDFRTAIYRWMGGKDLSDNIDGRNYLISEHEIDPEKIGIYGGSYGGFITIMALLTEPGKFKCGAAIRSVTDWAHYNHAYTSNILNTPETDPEAFRKSSPIYFAENLQDKLLMLHGIVDNNVQYQDVARLSQRFIELGKTNWNLVGYPIEPHGFRETTSWIDEYGRILQLFNQELLSD